MKQIVFVLKNGQVGYWKYQRGRLVHASLDGNPWNDFTPDFWDKWKLANQVSDGVDAILLADAADGWAKLPTWLKLDKKRTSAWTGETLLLLREDAEVDASIDGLLPNLQSSLALPEQFSAQLAKAIAKQEEAAAAPVEEVAPEVEEPVEPVVEPTPCVGPLTATVRIEEALQKAKPGEVFEGVVSSYSRFNGCFILVPDVKSEFRIYADDLKASGIKAPEKKFGKGCHVRLEFVELNRKAERAVFTVHVD